MLPYKTLSSAFLIQISPENHDKWQEVLLIILLLLKLLPYHMKKLILSLSLPFVVGILSAQDLKPISLEDIWTKGTFMARYVSGFSSLKDGRFYCSLDEKQNLLKYEFASGKLVDTLIAQSDIKSANNGSAISLDNITFSEDEKSILIATQTESIYRHSYRALYFVYQLEKKKIIKPLDEKIRFADFAPDASKIAYVKGNDLFLFDLIRMEETRITKDGKENEIVNGATDWVYEEEFAIWKGFSWNAAGDKIAFYRFDESKVKEFNMAMYGSLYPKDFKFKYPKAGEDNSSVHIYSYDLSTSLLTEIETGKEVDQYLPRFQWTKDPNVLTVQRLNRLQNKLEILLADAKNGASNIIYSEENKSYIDITDNLFFLPDGKSFLFSSEKDGYNHLYHYSLNGKMIKQITKGNWDIDEFYGYDAKSKKILYSSAEVNAAERYVYSIGINGKNKIQLTSNKGWNTASFNSDFTCFLHSFSDINTPPVYELMNADGRLLRVLEDNSSLKNKLKNYNISPAKFSSINNELGQSMNAFSIYPNAFDSTQKHPLLMYVYGGPGSQTVMNRWTGGNYLWYQMLAQQGFVILSVDGRGTGFKGEAFKKCTYLNLGKYEIEDQIYVAKKMAEFKYIDASKITLWGWSFGGYMASLGVTKGADVFTKGLAVAPVTNWRYYDNIYTERFMRKPQDNGENYDSNSPINHVEKIKGKYLIIHGTADDNVHFQNAVEMVDAMIKKGVRYDSEFYPNKNHGIGGAKTRLHLYERMTRFLLEN